MRFYGIFLYLSKLSYLLHRQLLKVIKINTIPIFRGKSENKVKYLYVAAVLLERRYAVQIDCVFPQTIPQNTPAFVESHSDEPRFRVWQTAFFHLLEKLEEHVLIAVLSVGKISRVHHAKPCYHIRILLYKLAVFAFGHILHAFTSLHILKRRSRQKGFIQNKKINPHE